MKRNLETISANEPPQKEAKRQQTLPCTPTSIDDLNSRKVGALFQGDVIVAYKAILNKDLNKELLRIDLTDKEGEMTVTLNVTGHQIEAHQKKLLPSKGVSIKEFNIAPKTNYDRGDCDYILLLNNNSTIENIPPVCNEFKFIPNTTIKQLLRSTDNYTIGTLAAVVTTARKSGTQFVFEIKDGLSVEDKAQ
ncbi:hypothetical protein KI387_002311, partial [Taxus chinensis]